MIFAIMFGEENLLSPERVVVHARVTGLRGPWVGRRSRLAGPRPDDRRRARGVAGPALRAGRGLPRGGGRVRGRRAVHPEEFAEIRQAAADELLAVETATTGRRGPGQPGSARIFPGQSSSPAAAFGPGMPLDVLPGCAG